MTYTKFLKYNKKIKREGEKRRKMEELDLKELLECAWKKKYIIVLIILIFIAIGTIYSYCILKPEYKATIKIILTQNTKEENSVIDTGGNIIPTYKELIKTNNVLKIVVNNINNSNVTVESIKSKISIDSAKNSELLEITVKNSDANLATQIANELIKVSYDKISQFYNLNTNYIIDKAEPNTTPYNINHKKDIVTFAFIGIAVAGIYILAVNMLKDKQKK